MEGAACLTFGIAIKPKLQPSNYLSGSVDNETTNKIVKEFGTKRETTTEAN